MKKEEKKVESEMTTTTPFRYSLPPFLWRSSARFRRPFVFFFFSYSQKFKLFFIKIDNDKKLAIDKDCRES